MPIRCPRCRKELQRGVLRCRHCGGNARQAPEAAELEIGFDEVEQVLDLDDPRKKR